ncbi:integral membrane protein [Beggiatoa sp. PS]|nr:integral membrane protein [Beggiatoa sp. PS]
MSMLLKYQEFIHKIPNCPPSDSEYQEITAFRFCFEDWNHKNNFLPVLLINPQRINTARFKKDSDKCAGYALSFFNTLENAKKRYFELKYKRGLKNIDKILGTHIAQGLIKENDGILSKNDKKGHFNLHEFENVDLKNQFSLICAIMENENHGNA